MAHYASEHDDKDNKILLSSQKLSSSDRDPEPGLLTPDNACLVRILGMMSLTKSLMEAGHLVRPQRPIQPSQLESCEKMDGNFSCVMLYIHIPSVLYDGRACARFHGLRSQGEVGNGAVPDDV